MANCFTTVKVLQAQLHAVAKEFVRNEGMCYDDGPPLQRDGPSIKNYRGAVSCRMNP
jgi:hypothetical protein